MKFREQKEVRQALPQAGPFQPHAQGISRLGRGPAGYSRGRVGGSCL